MMPMFSVVAMTTAVSVSAQVADLRLVSVANSSVQEPAVIAWTPPHDDSAVYYAVEGLQGNGDWTLISTVSNESTFAAVWLPVCTVRVGIITEDLLAKPTGFSEPVDLCNVTSPGKTSAKALACTTLNDVAEVIVGRTDTSVQLEWDVDSQDAMSEFSVEMKHLTSWKEVAELSPKPIARPDGCAGQSVNIRELLPSTSYTFRVTAVIGAETRRSSVVKVKTMPSRCSTSLLGEPLFDPNDAAATAIMSAERVKAQAEYNADHSELNTVWLARVDGFLYNWKNAMHLLDEGMEHFPESFRVPRHIGHRLIGLRSVENASTWLELAREHVQGQPATAEFFPIEARVIPAVPKSSSQFNIYYHLGLSHFLAGDYEAAASVYEEGFHWAFSEYDEGDDAFIAMNYWLVNTYQRMGTQEALQASAKLLANVSSVKSDYTIIEKLGWGYWYGLLLWKGDMSPEEVLQMATTKPGIELDTYGYAVAQYLFVQDDEEEQRQARQLMVILRADPQWSAFGYIGAEYDLFFSRNASQQNRRIVI